MWHRVQFDMVTARVTILSPYRARKERFP